MASLDEALLAARMRALSAFAPGYFHDLKGPLNTIILRLELLRAAPVGSPDDKRRASVGAIEEQVRRLDRMLQSWLDYTASAAPRDARLDLRDVVQDVVALVSPLARKQRLDLSMTLPDEPMPIAAPTDAMVTVVLDLVRQAAHGLDPGAALSVTLEREGGNARLTVRGRDLDAAETMLAARVASAAGGTCALTSDARGRGVVLHVPRAA